MQLPKALRSAAFRFAVAYALLFAGSALALVGFIYWNTAAFMAGQTDQIIKADIDGLMERYNEDGLNGLARAIRERLNDRDSDNDAYLLANPEGDTIAGNLTHWTDLEKGPTGWMLVRIDDEVPNRPRIVRLRHIPLPDGHHLLVGRDIRERQEVQGVIIDALGWSLAATVVLAAGGGAIFRRALMRRVERVTLVSEEIISGDLDRRVPVTGSDDEFDHLASTLNRMLDQIEGLMEGIRHVSDTIAHDLRSPLSRLRVRLEQALADPPGDAPDAAAKAVALRAVVERTMGELDGIIRLFNSLLRISQVEAGTRREAFRAVDLGRIVGDVGELYEPVAEEKALDLSIDQGATAEVLGDSSLLSQATANLVDNALKYTPPGGHVRLAVENRPEGATIIVADTGPGIPAEARGRVTERFYRLDDSRSTPGNGLGLALVAAVAKLHGGRLELGENAPHGLLARLVLPPRPVLV